jgi:hypothetical protein
MKRKDGKYTQQTLWYKILNPTYTQRTGRQDFFKDSKLPLVPRRQREHFSFQPLALDRRTYKTADGTESTLYYARFVRPKASGGFFALGGDLKTAKQELKGNLPEKRRTMWALTAPEMKECRWLKPHLVAQIEFTEWTPDGHLRHAIFVGYGTRRLPGYSPEEGNALYPGLRYP